MVRAGAIGARTCGLVLCLAGCGRHAGSSDPPGRPSGASDAAPPDATLASPAADVASEYFTANASLLDTACLSPIGDAPAPMPAFLALTSGARVVLLGEEQHGVREFSALKSHAMARLITDGGVRVVLLEQGSADAAPLDRWVRDEHGTGGETPPVHGLYWCWASTEFAAFATWLRTYNRRVAPSDRVRIVGIDVQSPRADLTALHEALSGTAAPMTPEEINAVRPLADDPQGYARLDEAAQDLCLATLERLRERARAIRTPEQASWGFLPEQAAEGALGAEEVCRIQDPARASNERDFQMGFRIVRMMQMETFPRAGAWTHNGHLNMVRHGIVNERAPSSLVIYLRERDVLAVALSFGHGSFRLMPGLHPGAGEVTPRTLAARPGSWGDVMGKTPGAVWLCDLRAARWGPINRSFEARETTWGPEPIAELYEAVFFVREVNPTQPLGPP